MAPIVSVVPPKQAHGVPRRARSSSLPSPSTRPRKAALLIGCKYEGNEFHQDLVHPHRDVFKVENLLKKHYNYEAGNIVVLLDDGKHDPPTRDNIEKAMKNLVAGSKAGDHFFFHFSGHGEQTPCDKDDKTEVDGLDEAIIPCDASDAKETWIIDNDMNKLLVRKLHVNAQLIALFDMCHSGTALDLKHYCYNDEAHASDASVHIHGAEPAYRRDSIHEGAIHICKRTSHDTVENETQRLSELPLGAVETSPNGGDAARGKNVRLLSHMSCKSTMHCEFSENSDAYSIERLPVDEQAAQRTNTCADCGGSVDEYGSARGYKPDRPTPQKPERKKRITIVWDDEGFAPVEEERALATRRHSEPSVRNDGCLSSLQSSWLYQVLKRRFNRSGHDKKNDNAHLRPSRSSTATSATPLLDSSRASAHPRSSASNPVVARPLPLGARPNRHSAPTMGNLTLGPIQEQVPRSPYSSEGEDIPRCTSPQEYDPDLKSPLSQEYIGCLLSNGGTSEPSGAYMRRRPVRTVHYQQQQQGQAPHPRKCKCRLSSGEKREHGQVITISAANDEQLAWETQKGSLTSALVEILEKDPRPTYSSLLKSMQTRLNNTSDDIRRYVDRELKRVRIRNCVADRATQGKGKQKKGLQRSASASQSRRGSRKSGDNIGQDFMSALEQTLEKAKGGPVQRCMIGSENYMDLDKTWFWP